MKTADEIRRISLDLSGEDVCAELLALSVVEHSYTPASKIRLELGQGGGTLRDTGRGMRLAPDLGDTLSHAERALTGYYPCLPSNAEIEAILSDLVWGERGSLGPSLANFACSSYRFTSMRGGEVWSQEYQHGKPGGLAVMLGFTEETGTLIEFQTLREIDHARVVTLVEALCSRIAGLAITLDVA